LVKFDHMMLPVSDCFLSRDWYVQNLGFKVEFENAAAGVVAIQDDNSFTIFLQTSKQTLAGAKCALTLQVKHVDQTHQELVGKGIAFVHPPQKVFWGYGTELADPDGYPVRLWDEVSMLEKGSV
jgi:uncharacterized glyoxalase superfamily protein PhnB